MAGYMKIGDIAAGLPLTQSTKKPAQTNVENTAQSAGAGSDAADHMASSSDFGGAAAELILSTNVERVKGNAHAGQIEAKHEYTEVEWTY